MVIDIDQEEIFETVQSGALQAIAFQQNHRVVRTFHALRDVNLIDAGQLTVMSRNSVCRHQVGSLAHLLQHHSQRQHRSNRIAVRLRMRAQQELLALAQDVQNLGDRVVIHSRKTVGRQASRHLAEPANGSVLEAQIHSAM